MFDLCCSLLDGDAGCEDAREVTPGERNDVEAGAGEEAEAECAEKARLSGIGRTLIAPAQIFFYSTIILGSRCTYIDV